MSRIAPVMILALLVASGAVAQSADSISAASRTAYYAKSSLDGEELWKALETRQCAVALATVNGDGSPNLAVVIPGVDIERKALYFGIAPNQTLENLKSRRLAVLSAYIYAPSATDKFERNKGARIVLELVSDPEAVAALLDRNKGRGVSPATIFLRIVRVLPIG